MKINPDKTEIMLLRPSSLNKDVIINGFIFEGECIRFSSDVNKLIRLGSSAFRGISVAVFDTKPCTSKVVIQRPCSISVAVLPLNPVSEVVNFENWGPR